MAVVALLITGFCWKDVNPLGPVHVNVPEPVADRAICDPAHTGPLLFADIDGAGLTCTLVVAVAWHPDALVTVTT
jgi:hypothetical protein